MTLFPAEYSCAPRIIAALAIGTVVGMWGCRTRDQKQLDDVSFVEVSEESLNVISSRGGNDPELGEIAYLAWAPGGRAVVYDGLAQRIEIYTRTGWSHSIGRPGAGPGEFSAMVNQIIPLSEGVIVVDGGNGRISLLGYDGTLLGESPLSFVGQGIPLQAAADAGERALVQFRRLEAQLTDSIRVVWPPTDQVFGVVPTGRSLSTPGGGAPVYTIFGAETYWQPWKGQLFSTHSGSYVVVRGQGLVRDTVLTLAVRKTPMEESDRTVVRAAYERELVDAGMPLSQVAAAGGALLFADSLPPVIDFKVDSHGGFWIQRGAHPGTISTELGTVSLRRLLSSALWDQWDSNGRLIRRVRFPPNFMPMDFQGDAILGVYFDANEVESVATLQFERLGQ